MPVWFGGRDSDQAGGALILQDAEDAEPRLTARPRRTRHNRIIGSAVADFASTDASAF